VGAFERDLQALLDELGAEAPILIGHSLGAHVALAFAARHASVRAVVLVDPSRGASPSRRRATRLALTLNPSYATRDHAVRRFRFLPGAAHASEGLRRTIAEESVAQRPDGRWGFKFDERWFALPPTDRPDPSRVACPVLIVRGADSPLLTVEGAAALAADLPRARVVEIADAGHHVIVDQPDAWLAAVEAFLDEVAPRRDQG
jgi:N-formylmaleamate deformylase